MGVCTKSWNVDKEILLREEEEHICSERTNNITYEDQISGKDFSDASSEKVDKVVSSEKENYEVFQKK